MDKQCGSCLFYAPHHRESIKEEMGFCHRYAPRPLVILNTGSGETPTLDAWWPEVLVEEWCGEWQPTNRQGTS